MRDVDPTYDRERIDANPDWALAFLMSEIENDAAPMGWGKFIPLARSLREKFALKSMGGEYETRLQRAAAKNETIDAAIAEAVASEREECAKIVEDVLIAGPEEIALAKHVARCVRRQPREVQ